MNKIDKAILTIKNAESLALKYQDYGFHLAFSGGKDSQVIYHLCKMAGVKFKAFMQVTTIDPPELMKFVRKNYPDVIMQRPPINFYKLIIKKKSLPTQKIRFCCNVLKEQSGAGTVTILGIRKSESLQRSKRNELEISGHKYSNSLDQFNIDNENQILCIKGKDKILLSPIIDWANADVWNFIRNNNIEYCKLYDNGFKRIGCIFCPMCTKKEKVKFRKIYPRIEIEIKKSIAELVKNGYGVKLNNNIDDVFNWWLSGKSQDKYLADKKQIELF